MGDQVEADPTLLDLLQTESIYLLLAYQLGLPRMSLFMRICRCAYVNGTLNIYIITDDLVRSQSRTRSTIFRNEQIEHNAESQWTDDDVEDLMRRLDG